MNELKLVILNTDFFYYNGYIIHKKFVEFVHFDDDLELLHIGMKGENIHFSYKDINYGAAVKREILNFFISEDSMKDKKLIDETRRKIDEIMRDE